ncbi:MAG: DUF2085 domain-containing protein [Cyanobacteria bacterium Co-bin8]|nr:DUF2085 domain-containing protein [Cyanobacteria bacterium Co-bin8]
MQGTVSSFQRPSSWQSLLADVVLVGLVSGPLAAPFLAASGLPGLTLIADIIYAMGQRVCPQPELGLALAEPYQMAVCMRCYGTVLGLVIMRWLYHKDHGRSAYWLEQYGLKGFVATFVLCLFYPLELALQGFSGWGMHHPLMMLFGLIAGLGLGAYLMPSLHSRIKTL